MITKTAEDNYSLSGTHLSIQHSGWRGKPHIEGHSGHWVQLVKDGYGLVLLGK